jgi:hypothetical protein
MRFAPLTIGEFPEIFQNEIDQREDNIPGGISAEVWNELDESNQLFYERLAMEGCANGGENNGSEVNGQPGGEDDDKDTGGYADSATDSASEPEEPTWGSKRPREEGSSNGSQADNDEKEARRGKWLKNTAGGH